MFKALLEKARGEPAGGQPKTSYRRGPKSKKYSDIVSVGAGCPGGSAGSLVSRSA
jgi:hypothetical protein